MAKAQRKGEEDLKRLLTHEIRNAINYDSTELSDKRAKVLEYIQGEMRDLPVQPNRSSVVTKDTKDVIQWIMPGLMRIFRGSDQMFEFEAQGPEDDESAKQANDYINYKFDKAGGYQIVYNGSWDALAHSYAIVKTWWDNTEETEISEHTGIGEEQLIMLAADDDVQVLTGPTPSETSNVQDMEGNPVQLFDVKIERIKRKGKMCVEVIPPENFLMHKDDTDLADKPRFTCHRDEKTRSDLIELGFDRKKVLALPTDNIGQWSEEDLARDEDRVDIDDSMDPSTDLIELYECYIRTDMDGDGVAEMVRAYYAGAYGTGELLEWEIIEDDHPFTAIPCFPMPHRFDGMSIADDVMDWERVKTVLWRQALDNTYSVNNPQKEVEEGSVLNKDALVRPKFGQPIFKKRGSAPIVPHTVPFVADKALSIAEAVDSQIESRTGVSKMAKALDAEALQNQSATANQNAHDASRAKQELIARNMAEGWRQVGRRMLKLFVQHQDRPEVIRLRGEWVQIDPRHWNADMDCSVNVGLGTGSKDRDVAMLNQIVQQQFMMASALADRGLGAKAVEYLPKIGKTLVKLGAAAGLRNADDYHIEFTDEDVETAREIAAQPPQDPKMEAEKAKLQMEQQKAQMNAQLDKQKMDAEIAIKREQLSAEIQLKREQLLAELELKREQIEAELMLRRENNHMAVNAKVATSPVRMGGDAG